MEPERDGIENDTMKLMTVFSVKISNINFQCFHLKLLALSASVKETIGDYFLGSKAISK